MRIPVWFGDVAAGGADAWLVEEGKAPPGAGYAVGFALPAQRFGHVPGCRCCTPRGAAADALTRMFRDRTTGAAPFFKRVIVLASKAGEAMVREALAQDAVSQARYVPVDAPGVDAPGVDAPGVETPRVETPPGD